MSKIIFEYAAKPAHIQLIRQSRPLANANIAEADIKDPVINATYPVYNLGLNELKSSTVRMVVAQNLRMNEVDANHNIASSFEVSANATEATVPAIHTDARYLALLNSSFGVVNKLAQAQAAPAMLRMINIPSLHTEAYWLHFDDSHKNDLIVPIHSFDFPANVPVPYEVFIRKMTEAAKAVPDVSTNMMGG